jgi:hypothetical protein
VAVEVGLDEDADLRIDYENRTQSGKVNYLTDRRSVQFLFVWRLVLYVMTFGSAPAQRSWPQRR